MEDLQSSIQTLAARFALDLVTLIRSASIDDLIAMGGTEKSLARLSVMPVHDEDATTKPHAAPPARPLLRSKERLRRSDVEMQSLRDRIINVIHESPNGINADGLRKILKITQPELKSPMKMALGSNRIRKTGERRLTIYLPV